MNGRNVVKYSGGSRFVDLLVVEGMRKRSNVIEEGS